jgi:glycosyltransferase involved in cell wall biosynthesis
VHDAEAILAASVAELSPYLTRFFPLRWRLTIADNASTDGTSALAAALAREEPRPRVPELSITGRGAALRAARSTSDADVLRYMDVDLSTNLDSFLPLVAPSPGGHTDVVIGTRLRRTASERRQLKRELLSRGYDGLVHVLFGNSFSDAQRRCFLLGGSPGGLGGGDADNDAVNLIGSTVPPSPSAPGGAVRRPATTATRRESAERGPSPVVPP